ncbi:CrcB protein [Gracilibacillus boraciitolerans JCM 21714]|uniref:Fluoride-specific ion channel FluC n=1 Tax=Gracilibacillus boraciitolerans JCM 21714 TaxID=1298598 RepID=W4VPV4_9BACI|nr:fluoride efflux transporter CrcB [Gracilibacillus boraciitolerans]GAE95237.1 CrcB protein [Gracilibacillus boraciitolerans JCM 21714]
MTFISVLMVGIGGFFGAMARFAISQLFNKRKFYNIPIATLFVNIVGSFLLGFLLGAQIKETYYLLLGVGFMGSFTTFSTFKLEGIQMHVQQRKKDLILYNLVCYGLGIPLAFSGYLLGQ